MLIFMHIERGSVFMIILHNVGIGIEEYEAKGKENDLQTFNRYPECQCMAKGNVHRNGYYWLYGIEEGEFYIPICQFRCLACKVTISILPSFLIPYFPLFSTYLGFYGGAIE